jgi:hypothetical protein
MRVANNKNTIIPWWSLVFIKFSRFGLPRLDGLRFLRKRFYASSDIITTLNVLVSLGRLTQNHY